MWLDGILLALTLAIALIGSLTSASDSLAGKLTISVLLIISTFLSFWLKRRESKQSDRLRRSVDQLKQVSPPTDRFMDSLGTIFSQVCTEEGYRLYKSYTVIQFAEGTGMVWLLWRNENRHIDSLAGAVALNRRDLGELETLDEPQLRSAVRDIITGKWGHDDLQTDADLMHSRILTIVRGWLIRIGFELAPYEARRTAGFILSIALLDSDGNKTGGQVLKFSSEELRAMYDLPAIERGARIVRKTEEWRRTVASNRMAPRTTPIRGN